MRARKPSPWRDARARMPTGAHIHRVINKMGNRAQETSFRSVCDMRTMCVSTSPFRFSPFSTRYVIRGVLGEPECILMIDLIFYWSSEASGCRVKVAGQLKIITIARRYTFAALLGHAAENSPINCTLSFVITSLKAGVIFDVDYYCLLPAGLCSSGSADLRTRVTSRD